MKQLNTNQNIKTKAEQSGLDFKRWVWPLIKSALGDGELIGVEGTAFDKFKFKLDRIAGIDAFQVAPSGDKMRGLACRIQYTNRPFESFSVRKKLSNGSIKATEYEKRFNAIKSEQGFIYPHLTVQAYLFEQEENSRNPSPKSSPARGEKIHGEIPRKQLMGVAVCRTRDLIKFCSHGYNTRVQVNRDGSEFFVVPWENFKSSPIAFPILILGAKVEAFYSGESFKI